MKIPGFLGLGFIAIAPFYWIDASAQYKPSDYGVITKDELSMKYHPLDTSADAIILSDIGRVNIQSNNTSFERHLRIKLLKKNAFKEWGQVKLNVDKGGLRDLKATTHNLVNGTIESTTGNDAIYKGKTVKGVQEISCAFENLQEGSVVEISYSELSYGFVIPFWKFQQTIATLWSEYSINDPYSNFKYQYHITGSHKLSKHLHAFLFHYKEDLLLNNQGNKSILSIFCFTSRTSI